MSILDAAGATPPVGRGLRARLGQGHRVARRAAAWAAVVAALSLSCTAKAATGFAWSDASGARLRFSQSSSWPEGEEGRFGRDRASNRYCPLSPLSAGKDEALVVSVHRLAEGASPRLSLAVSAEADGSKPSLQASFPLLEAEQSLVLPLGRGGRIACLSVKLEAGGANDASPSFEIRSVSLAPSFRGIDRSSGSLRVSSGFTLAKGKGRQELTISEPFAGQGENEGEASAASKPGLGFKNSKSSLKSGLLIEYGSAPLGAELRIVARPPASGGGAADIRYLLKARPKGCRTVIDPSLFPTGYGSISLQAPEGLDIKTFAVTELGQKDYELADLGRVFMSDSIEGDYALYRWDLLPSVLVFDFKDYATQDAYLKRIAFFVEKIGYRGKLIKDEVIAPLHAWNAHDYSAEGLASFFAAAESSAFKLGKQEEELEALLLERGLIVRSGKAIVAGSGALISVSRESSPYQRWTFLVHESTHALYFTQPEYRSFVRSLWASVGRDERWFWRTYFTWAAYDSSSDELMGNEFQAYLLQQPASDATRYFTTAKTAELLEKHPELQEKVDAYMAEFGGSFEQRARQLEDWLRPRYGIETGRTIALTRLRK